MDTHTPQFNSSSLRSRTSQSSPSPSPSHSNTSSAHNKRKISAIEDNVPTLPPPTSDSDDINVKVENTEVVVSLTEAVRTGGAYSAREESLKREEAAGRLKFVCYRNDGFDEHMVWLIGLKNIFSRQLPNMPREYIVRLVMDRSHKSVMVIRENRVVGGITYRPYIRCG